MKKLILGLVIGMMIGSATVAFAAVDLVGTEVKAIFASFNLVINGEPKVLETVPLVYNGTSYLPVRDIANIVGFDVTYKADSRTIELNTATSATYNPISAKGVTTMATMTTVTSTATVSEYATLKSISERDGIAIAFNQYFKGLQKGNVKIDVDLDNISVDVNNPTNIQTPYGSVRLFKDNLIAKINIADWDAVYSKIPH